MSKVTIYIDQEGINKLAALMEIYHSDSSKEELTKSLEDCQFVLEEIVAFKQMIV